MMQSIDISDCSNAWEAVKASNMDYKVTTEKLVTSSGIDSGLVATVSDNKFYGAVSPTYKVTQNKDVFTFADDLIKQSTDLHFDSAGTLENGKRAFMALQMPNKKILDDEYSSQLIILNSFDGKSGIKICYLPKRIICSNMINMAFKTAKERWSIRHSVNANTRLMEAVASIENADFFWTSMKEEFEKMSVQKVNFNKFLSQLMEEPDKDASETIKRHDFETRGKILSIYNNKNDLQNYSGTAYKAFQTIADYVSNGEPVRKTDTFEENRFASFLDGNKLMLKAQELLAA